jgi:hypothetical protein
MGRGRGPGKGKGLTFDLEPRPAHTLPSDDESAMNIYPAPLDMDKHSLSHDVVKGPEAPDQAGSMQDAGYGLPRTRLFGRWADEPFHCSDYLLGRPFNAYHLVRPQSY